MPIKSGYSRKVIAENIGTMIHEGKPRNQAIAIAHQSARDSYWKSHPNGFLPGWIYQDKNTGRNNPKKERKSNPVPPSSQSQVAQASDLYSRFSGHEAEAIGKLDKPRIPDVLIAVGEIDGIMYSTVRDGVLEKYLHQFKKNCRPLFCVSHDGKQLFMLGGAYDFTELGIVDKT